MRGASLFKLRDRHMYGRCREERNIRGHVLRFRFGGETFEDSLLFSTLLDQTKDHGVKVGGLCGTDRSTTGHQRSLVSKWGD